ncbi:MAG TPA: SprB repeat-containing protein, partial [Saprospiraceae bacterium]|nr:SprB repeat-containing protein [Saprospiraceae bacterium]
MFRLFLICFGLLCLPPSATFGQCALAGQIDSLRPVRCAGDSDGSLFVSVSGATLPLSFFLNGSAQPLMPQDLIGTLPSGPQVLIIADADGCRDTLAFVIPAPDTLRVQIFSENIACNGDDTGKAWTAATGGTLPMAFTWQTCAGASLGQSDTLRNLFAGCYVVVATDGNGCTATDSVAITEPPPFQFAFLQDSVNCFGGSDGSATVQVSGATPPYRFRWDNLQTTPTATGLPAGFHSVIVTDTLGCEAATLARVLQPPALALDTAWTTSVQCFGQSNGTAVVLMLPGSGTPPYRYNWGQGPSPNPNTSGLAAGVYTVTVTDWHNCTFTATVTVFQPAAPLAAMATQIKAEVCAGDCKGEATIAVSGGTEPYDFMWDKPGIPKGTSMPKNLCPDQYSVTVSDARGCTRLVKFSIQPGVPLDFRFDRIGPSCASKSDGRILSDITGGMPPYRYRWDNGDTTANLSDLPCGKYVLTLTDAAGCTRVSSVELVCPPLLQVQSIVAQAVRCFGGADGSAVAVAVGGTGMLSYLWSDPKGQMTVKADSLAAGIYTVTVTDANG